jgi:hypothetical protein
VPESEIEKIVLMKRLRIAITFRRAKGNKSNTIMIFDLRGGFPMVAIVNIKKQMIL